MNKTRLLFIMILCLITAAVPLSVQAGEITPGYRYRPDNSSDLPAILYTGWEKQCGDFVIRLVQDPVLNKSTNYMVADGPMTYLTIHVAITNKGSESVGWLTPDSFVLQDMYMNRLYGTYKLDVPISAKTAEGFHENAFFTEIKPGETLYTPIVFMVYGDVQGWVLTFSPRSYFEETAAVSVSFRLPKALTE